MRHRRPAGLHPALLLALLLLAPLPGPAAEEEPVGPPLLRSGTASFEVAGQRFLAPYDVTAVGPLFPLQPLVARLGGELEIGPLQQRHALTVGETTAQFGPGVRTLTFGGEIVDLSQPPRAGTGGLHVPLDLLERLYGERLAYRFSWNDAASTLVVERPAPREIAVRSEIVHLQGVTTVVLTFGEQPHLEITEEPRRIVVDLISDRLRPLGPADPPAAAWVESVDVSPQRIVIRHVESVVAESYELDGPYRLVFDLYRGATTTPEPAPRRPRPPSRTRDLPGIHTIVVDPGHGGENSGAISGNGVAEKEITLAIGTALAEALERALPVRVLLTRDSDQELNLDQRSAIANQNKADLFVSLHVNSAYGRSAHGAETFFLSLQASDELAAEIAAVENRSGGGAAAANPLDDLDLILWDLAQSHHLAESQRYARLIQEELNGALGLTDRGVKQAPFRVLRGAAMPAVLVELGFLSNPEEERKLQDPGYRSRLVDALVRATQRYRSLTQGRVAAGEPASP